MSTLFILDEKQRQAVFFPPEKSLIVEAPPGYGKTYVMARRIEYLIESRWMKPPNKILGLTFTNAAAGEMQDDIRARLHSEKLDLIQVMTFHSLGYKILRAYGHLIGINKNFQIVSEIDRSTILEVVIARMKVKITEEQYRQWLTEKFFKGNKGWRADFNEADVKLLSTNYRKELGETKLDYDSLLFLLVKLFTNYPTVLEIYRSVYKYILVDEFQDTNMVQFNLLSTLIFGSHDHKVPQIPVFILADKEQAIYRFQGATPENIDLAQTRFQCEKIALEVNYRCNAEEISILTRKIRGADILPGRTKVPLEISTTTTAEANTVLDRIGKYKGSLDNIAILAPNEFLLKEIQNLLEEKNIPYIFVPDFRPKSIQKTYCEIFSRISRLPDEKKYNGTLANKICQIYADLKSDENDDEVLKALLILAMNFDSRGERATFSERARQFYNDIFIQVNWGNLLRKTVKNKVFLSTIHSVKGLQFSQVHICGLSNFAIIYHQDCIKCSWGKRKKIINEQLLDAAKLLYVGVSRAQDALFLYSIKLSAQGKNRSIVCLLSPYKEFLSVSGEANFCGE